MLILALDTATRTSGMALFKDGKLYGEIILNVGLTHSVSLLPSVHNLLNISNVKIEDIDALAFASGPGSFTGLRIGGAFIIGLAQPRNLPIYAVPTLDAFALNGEGFDGLIAPILDARKNEVYSATYKMSCGEIKKLYSEEALSPQEFCDNFQDPSKVMVIGDAVDKYRDVLEKRGFYIPNALRQYSRPSNIAYIAYKKYLNDEQAINYQEIKPFYIRASEAEVRLREKSGCENA